MSRRTERIAEQLRGEISRILSEEATDPRLRLVTLTRVDVGERVLWRLMNRLRLPVTTNRLVIRGFQERDRILEVAINDNAALFAHLPIEPKSEAQIDEYIQARLESKTFDKIGGTVALIIETSQGGEYVGAIQLTPSVVDPLQLMIGWMALQDHHGKGLMTEAVQRVVGLVFDLLTAHRIVAEIIGGNDASVRLAERLGFRKEAHFMRSTFLKGAWRDEMVYSILRDEWSTTAIDRG